jgi:gamma-glutamylcyclotransferase
MIRLRGKARRLVATSWTLSWFYYRLHGLTLAGWPGEQVWYFAYGANMHDRAFRKRRRMRPVDQRVGRLRGYRLRFNLEGRPKGRAAPANLSPDAEAEVWGVLYKLTRRDLLRLDSTEGVPGRGYRPQWFEAEDRDGRVLPAIAYIARGNEIDGYPSLRYLTLLREGARANGLPGHWLQFLDSVEHAKRAEAAE